MEVAKLAAPPNLEVRFVSCNESAIKRWLSSELEEIVFSLTHELFMTKHHTVTLRTKSLLCSTHAVPAMHPHIPAFPIQGLQLLRNEEFHEPRETSSHSHSSNLTSRAEADNKEIKWQ